MRRKLKYLCLKLSYDTVLIFYKFSLISYSWFILILSLFCRSDTIVNICVFSHYMFWCHNYIFVFSASIIICCFFVQSINTPTHTYNNASDSCCTEREGGKPFLFCNKIKLIFAESEEEQSVQGNDWRGKEINRTTKYLV